MGSNGSRLCLFDFEVDATAWCRSSVEDKLMLAEYSVSRVSCLVNGASRTGTIACASEETIEPGLDGRPCGVGGVDTCGLWV